MRNKKPGNLWSAILDGVVAGIEEAVDELSEKNNQDNDEKVADDQQLALNNAENSLDGDALAQNQTVAAPSLELANDESGIHKLDAESRGEDSGDENSEQKVGTIKCDIEINKDGISINKEKISSVLNHLVDSIVGKVRAKTALGLKKIESITSRGGNKETESELDNTDVRQHFRFRGKKLLESYVDEAFIYIPEGTEIIGASAFANLTAITHVTLPSSLRRIDRYAFSGCTNLKVITFPEGLIEIGKYAFSGCDGLKTVILPESLTKLGEGAFSECHSLVELVLPKQLRWIPSELCACCWGLEKVRWPEYVEDIGKNCFTQCCSINSPLDYFELRQNQGLVKVHIDINDWMEQYSEDLANSRIVAWYTLEVLQYIYGHTLDETSHKEHSELFYTILHTVALISNYDSYALFFALMHLEHLFCGAEVLWHPEDDIEFILVTTLYKISATGEDYRRLDSEIREHVSDICHGDLEGVLGAEGEANEDDPDILGISDIVDNYITNHCSYDEIVQLDSYDEKTGKYKEPSDEDLKQYVLWLRALDDLGVSPGTKRYNPRIIHNVAIQKGDYNYWEFVDIMDGLLRGVGRERVRYSPEGVSEFSLPTEWFSLWSKEITDGEPICDDTLTLVVYSYLSDEDIQKKSESSAVVHLFIILTRSQAVALRSIFERYALADKVHIWCDGFDMMRLHVVD